MKMVLIGGISALGLAMGGFLGGAPARADVSAATAEQAQRRADHYRDQAERYRAFGGMAWKVGLIEQAERQAAHYQAIADGKSEETAPNPTDTGKETALTPQCEATKPAVQNTTLCKE